MEIKGIGTQGIGQVESTATDNKSGVDFSKALNEAIQKVDAVQKEADQAIQQFSAGNNTIHETMIAMEKASLSFQLMVQVRNKIVSAYEEIMRTQV